MSRYIRMIGPQRPFTNRQRPNVQRFSFGVASLIPPRAPEPVEIVCHFRVVVPENALQNSQRLLQEDLCLGIPATLPKIPAGPTQESPGGL